MTQATAPAPQPTNAPAVPCPRCQKPLVDPNGLGWCKECGYCRSLEESQKTAPAAAPTSAPALNQLTATGSAIGQTPTWFWVTLIGIALVVGATFAGGRYLPLSPLERALVTTLQIAGGIAVMFLGQFIAVIRIAPEDSTLTFFDALFPFRLYGLVMKRLPRTRHTLYLGAWGVAAIVSAAVFIGGLDHWLKYLPNSKHKGNANTTQKAKL